MGKRTVTPGLLAAIMLFHLILGLSACRGSTLATDFAVPPTKGPNTRLRAPTRTRPTPAAHMESHVQVPTAVSKAQTSPVVATTATRELGGSATMGAEKVVSQAVADLAQRLGVSEEDIIVRSVKEVIWPDASLGCPQPDLAYAQVIIPGYRVKLEAQGQAYDYHAERTSRVVFCSTAGSDHPPSSKGIKDDHPWQPVEPIEPDHLLLIPEK